MGGGSQELEGLMDVSKPQTSTFSPYLPFPSLFCLNQLPFLCYIFFHLSRYFFSHLFEHKSHFPPLLSVSMPSIIQCVTNYVPIILNSSVYSHWLSNSVNIVFFFYHHLHLKDAECWWLLIFVACVRQKNIKYKALPVVTEYTGTIDCSRLRGTHTSTISIMLQIICIHTERQSRETNKSNCGGEHKWKANRIQVICECLLGLSYCDTSSIG